MGLKFGGADGDCPVTESYSDRLVRLPFYNDLTFEDQMKVVDACLTINFSDLHHTHVGPIWNKYVA